MALNTYVCCILVLFFKVGRLGDQEIGDAKALETIRRFIDVDFSKISGANLESLASAIKTLNPARTKGDWFQIPVNLWEFSKKGQESCLVLVEMRPGIHPGWDNVRITMMNRKGKSQFDSTFTTSMRCYMQGIEIETKTESEFPIIVLSTDKARPPAPGPDIKKQYFGKIGNRIDLIRLENSKHDAIRNNYIYDHFRCGPPAPSQSVEDWQSDLNSPDRLRNLRVLTWLGGVHRVVSTNQDGGEPEPDECIKRVNEVGALLSVRSRIKELTESKDEWIRQAATLALHPTDRW